MDKLYKLKDKLLHELENFAEKDITSGSTLEIVHNLSGAVKNICKIIDSDKDEGYSSRGSYYMGDVEPGRDLSYRGTYEGSYARGRRNAPRDSMGRYSGEGYSRHGDIAERIRAMVHEAPDEETRREIERLADKIERA